MLKVIAAAVVYGWALLGPVGYIEKLHGDCLQ
jgi:hypothetical protein